jgi:hypothetical protein
VQFYVNGASVGSATVSGNAATYVVTLPALDNTAYAQYFGDTNCPAATSSVLTLDVQPTVTTGVLLANPQQLLQGASVTLTALFTAQATTSNPYPGAPTGTVTFYTTLNGIARQLGTANLIANGQSTSIATYTTTGLQDGANVVSAQLGASRYFAASQAASLTIGVYDYSVAFSPPSATVTKGGSVTALVTVAPIDGFDGEVVLSCTPPANTETTCAISPAILSNGGGIGQMTIATTATTTTSLQRVAGGSLAVCLLALLWPGARRRRGLQAMLGFVVSGALLSVVGCSTIAANPVSPGGGGSTGTTGTPSGTQVFTVTAAGTDGQTTNLHSYQYQVTVQ